MKKQKQIVLSGIVLFCAVFLFFEESFAGYELFDKRLQITIKADEFAVWRARKHTDQYIRYSEALVMWRHRIQGEFLWKMYEKEDTIINFYTWLGFFYESAASTNENIRNAMDSQQRHYKYQLPLWSKDDILYEGYLDINKGPWTIRIGKQKVVWGEMELERTTDVVNPLDLRYSSPGVDDLDELKIPLYMLRTTYQSSLPGEMLFEFIFNPGDYQRIRTGVQGSDRGSPSVPNEELGGMGITGAIEWYKDHAEPRFSIANWETGLRVRGLYRPMIAKTPYEFLWTLQYFTAPDDVPIVDGDNVKEWQSAIGKIAISRAGNKSIDPLPSGHFYDAKRWHMWGLGLQTYDDILTKAVLIGEFAIFKGISYNRTEDNVATLPGETKRNFFTYGLSIRRPYKEPFIKKYLDHSARGYVDVDFSIYQGWILGGNIDELKRTFSYGNKSETTFTLQLMTAFRNQEFTPVIRVLYNTRNWGYYSPSITYSATTNLKISVGYTESWANNPTDNGVAAAYKNDRIYMKVRYEF